MIKGLSLNVFGLVLFLQALDVLFEELDLLLFRCHSSAWSVLLNSDGAGYVLKYRFRNLTDQIYSICQT